MFEVRSFFRYCLRFLGAYRQRFTWGRDNLLIAGTLGALAILAGFASGNTTLGNWWPQTQPVLQVYIGLLVVYALVQLPLSAWQLDHERDKSYGPQIRIEGHFESDERLLLHIQNNGPTDEFSARYMDILGAEGGGPLAPFDVRWRDAPGVDIVTIIGGSSRFIDVARAPDPEAQGQGGAYPAVPITFYSSTGEHQSWWRRHGPILRPILFSIHLRAHRSGLSRVAYMVVDMQRAGNQTYRAVYRDAVSGSDNY